MPGSPSLVPQAVGKLTQGGVQPLVIAIGAGVAVVPDQRDVQEEERDAWTIRQPARCGFFVLMDAIDRAKSTEPDKIQAALKATDLKARFN